VNPTNEKLFQAACGTFEVDIISLDMSARLPFYLKHSTVGLAVERGIYFELCYGAAIRGTTLFPSFAQDIQLFDITISISQRKTDKRGNSYGSLIASFLME